jgi:hypothetical protein
MWLIINLTPLMTMFLSASIQAASPNVSVNVIDMRSALQDLRSTLADITYDFVDHAPYLLVRLVGILFAWEMSIVINKIVNNISGRSKMWSSLRYLL